MRSGACIRTLAGPPYSPDAHRCRPRAVIAPEGTDTRPTGDRVREAIFKLYSPTTIAGTRSWICRRTGAPGLEALSRGGAGDLRRRSARPSGSRRYRFRRRRPGCHPGGTDGAPTGQRTSFRVSFDVALSTRRTTSTWPELLAALRVSLAVIESDRGQGDLGEHAGWDLIRHRRYGGTVVTMIRRR